MKRNKNLFNVIRCGGDKCWRSREEELQKKGLEGNKKN